MADSKPIDIKLDLTLWKNCEDDRGIRYSQLTIEQTPRALFEFIPIKEHLIFDLVFVKDIEFIFKRKKYCLQFIRTKESGEP